MSIEVLEQNIERESQIIRQIVDLCNQSDSLDIQAESGRAVDLKQKEVILKSIDAFFVQLRIINNAIPDLINNISFYKDLDKKQVPKQNLLNLTYTDKLKNQELSVAVKKNEEKKFLSNLSFHNSLSNKMTVKANQEKNESENLFFLINVSNKFFRKSSTRLSESGAFESIRVDLRKIASPYLLNTYLAMALFVTSCLFIIGLITGIVLFILGMSLLISLLAFLLLPLITLIIFYFYPSSRKNSLEKEINQELPFVTIYMAAIATSGIEPSKLFGILVTTHDYPFIQREVKKLNNLINFYGYDLVSALKAVSRSSPSDRLTQLFDGVATTITSGGELTDFLSKHSDSLLFDYRLEREKYTRTAETFMSIYISVVIAAPMIMMILFILMSLAQFGVGSLSPAMIGGLTILVISLLNFGFLVFLNMKQPKF
jgi:Flp pilus assembly protein TadB